MISPDSEIPRLPRARTVLLERQTLVRELLARVIHDHPHLLLLADLDAPDAGLHACLHLHPDLLVLDASLEETAAIDLIRDARVHLPRLRVLALANSPKPLLINRLREARVDGFVEKDQSLEILDEALSEIAAGRTYFTATWSRQHAAFRSDSAAVLRLLTRRDLDILQLVASGWTSRAIASHLHLSPRSVETFRYRLMRKLDVHSVAGLVDVALRSGILPPPQS